MGAALLAITPRNPLATFLLPVPMILCSAGQRSLPEREMLPPRDTTMIPLKWKLGQLFGLCVLLVPPSQQAESQGVGGGNRSRPPRGVGSLAHSGGKKECVWHTGGSWASLSPTMPHDYH